MSWLWRRPGQNWEPAVDPDFEWRISSAKRSELDEVLWGDWPRHTIKNEAYFGWLQEAITLTRDDFHNYQRVFDDKQFYLPLPRSQRHASCLYDGYVEYMICVIKCIAKNAHLSIDQIGEATDEDFQKIFDSKTPDDKCLQDVLRRQRVLWVIKHVTMLELGIDSKDFVSTIPTDGVGLLLRDFNLLSFLDNVERRRSSSSTLVSLQRSKTPEVKKSLSPDAVRVHRLVPSHSMVIEWVDSPLLHLDMPCERTLRLFWHASWCKAHSVARRTKHEFSICSILGFPATYLDEILQTYRLLFDDFSLESAQTYYRLSRGHESRQAKLKCYDTFMDITCGMKHQSRGIGDTKETVQGVFIDYARFEDAHRAKRSSKRWTMADFPHFRERLEALQDVIDSSKPAEEAWKSRFAFW